MVTRTETAAAHHETIHELQRSKQAGIIFKIDKVQWSFLEEMMKNNFFSDRWIGWIKKAVEGGRVGINLNGQPGEYFRTFKGLRQGDTLYPLLFNLVADALGTLLTNAKEKGHIKGLIPHLIDGGLTHLQYADDTVILLDRDDQSIRHIKFLLYCFELMSGLQINYEKSKVIVW